MRQKKIAIKSPSLAECSENLTIIPFQLSFLYKPIEIKEKIEECTASERRFCKLLNLALKTYLELRATYKKKGEEGVRQMARAKKTKTSKIPNIVKYLRDHFVYDGKKE